MFGWRLEFPSLNNNHRGDDNHNNRFRLKPSCCCLLNCEVHVANMLNSTGSANMSSELPPLPSYTLHPDDQILPYISNLYLSLLVPFIAYWALSFVFEFIDYYDLFPQYRIHTPAEIQNRNVVTRYEVARDVLLQQVLQAGMGAILALTEKEDLYGKADYDVAVWAQRLRIAQRALPQLLSFLGLNAAAISKNVSGSHPMVAALLAGGDYSLISQFDPVSGSTVPAFATWEMTVAKAIYWVIIPAIQFGLAVFIQDTWQYFLHRAMHMNKYLYSTLVLPLSCQGVILILQQQPSTPVTTVSMSLTRLALSTITPSKVFSSIPSAHPSRSKPQA